MDLDNRLDWVGRLVRKFSEILDFQIFSNVGYRRNAAVFLVFRFGSKRKIECRLDPVLIPPFLGSFVLAGVTRGVPNMLPRVIYADVGMGRNHGYQLKKRSNL